MPSGQLSPNQQFAVSYSTTIPGDTTLYYVRAVLRDTQSSAILQTLNLANVSSVPNRYTGVFGGVSDPSGLGRPVDVTISVYTDPGYTTLSQNYQITQFNYVVLQPWIQNLGTGGGLNIDYDKLQKMFDGGHVTNAEIGNEKAPKRERVNYRRLEEASLDSSEGARAALSEELKGHVGNVMKAITDIKRYHNETSQAHMARLDVLESRLNDFDGRTTKGQELSSRERLAMKTEFSSALKELREEAKNNGEELPKRMEERLSKISAEFQGYLADNLSEKEIKMVYNMAPQKKEKEVPRGISLSDVQSLLRG